jgi:hypothetical protein
VNEQTSAIDANREPIPDLPQAITSFGAAVLDDILYVYGGHHGQAHHYSQAGQSGNLLQLDLKEPSAWQVAATGPKLQGLAMLAHAGGLYRIGGFTAKNTDDEDQDLWSVSDLTRFAPGDGEEPGNWQALPPMPTPRSSFDAVIEAGTLYVIGGWAMEGDKEAVWQETAVAVDLTCDELEWKQLAAPGFQRRALSVGALDGKVYAIGGMQPDGKVTTETAIYDPSSDSWSQGPPLPGDDREGFGTDCCTNGSRLYVSTASGKVLELDEDGGSWQTVRTLQAGRFFHRMLPLGEKHVILLGGANMQTGRFAAADVVRVAE